MNFKFTKWKVIVSIVVVILWILLMQMFAKYTFCKECVPPICEQDYGNWMVPKITCDCKCQNFGEMFYYDLKNILIPFALTYVIWSLFQKKK